MLEMTWADKYRPRNFDDLTYHPEVNNTLRDLAKTPDFPHIIFHGPEGAGKKTRVINFIQEVYGVNSLVLTEEPRSFKLDNNKVIEYTLLNSSHHIEVTPSDNEWDDRHIIQKVVKDIASSKEVNSKNSKKFKILVINEAHKLTKEAQGSLRRTMQKYMSSCRMILVCNHVHRLILPIRSRCLNLRIPAPTNETINDALTQIIKDQALDIKEESLMRIINTCNRNLRDAISQLECFKFSRKNDMDLLQPFRPEIKEICKLIVSEQSPAQLQKIRNTFYDLLVNLVEPSTVLKLVLEELLYSGKISDEVLKGLIGQAAYLEQTIAQGSKPVIHLQCFAAYAMEAIVRSRGSV